MIHLHIVALPIDNDDHPLKGPHPTDVSGSTFR